MALAGYIGGTPEERTPRLLTYLLAAACLATLSFTSRPAPVSASEKLDAIRLPVATLTSSADELLNGSDAAWSGASGHLIGVNRTPPLYEGDPMDDGYRPTLNVSLARSGGPLFLRLRWTDPTDSRPREAEKVADAGEPGLYKQHSLDIDRFADAACVMVPLEKGERAAFPSLMMGEPGAPVALYYWHRVRGFERLEAAGRGTTTRTGDTFPGATRRTADGWEAIFTLPGLPAGTPICFALWDGNRGQRDGLKYFSIWYELGP